MVPFPVNAHGRSCLFSTYKDPEESEKENQVEIEQAVTKKEFKGDWIAPAPEIYC